MDAHLFRRFCEDLVPALVGCRIEKIHQVTTGLTVFTLYGLGKLQERFADSQDTFGTDSPSIFQDKKQYLFFKEGKNPLLFFSTFRPQASAEPPAFVMRLRKHFVGRRIERVCSKWVERKIYMQIQGGTYLCLDLRQGIELLFQCSEVFQDAISETGEVYKSTQNTHATDILQQKEHEFPVENFLDNDLLGNQENSEEQTSNLLPFALSHSIEPSLNDGEFSALWPSFENLYRISHETNSKEKYHGTDNEVNGVTESISETLSETISDTQELWQAYPVLTPLLRKTIPFLDKEEAAALYADLQFGGGDVVVYTSASSKQKKFSQSDVLSFDQSFEICAWLLPSKLVQKMGFATEESKELLFEDSISALSHVGSLFLARLNQSLKAAQVKPLMAEVKRLEKLLQKLDKEEERLQKMVDKKEWALLIQANLYQLNADEKKSSLTLTDFEGSTQHMELDASKSIRANMEHFFHQAGRGKRGFAHLSDRKAAVFAQKEQALQAALQKNAFQKDFSNVKAKPQDKNKYPSAQNSNQQKIKVNKGSQFKPQAQAQPHKENTKGKQKFPTQIQVFRSSDGFTLLRGRDTKGNGQVLKMSNGHDYWVHVADGAGAHVIIRRDHPSQDVPLQTMHEAGNLALLKSGQKDHDKGLVQYSLAKYIRPMKNAAQGLVHVDKSEGTYLVEINPQLEDSLK